MSKVTVIRKPQDIIDAIRMQVRVLEQRPSSWRSHVSITRDLLGELEDSLKRERVRRDLSERNVPAVTTWHGRGRP